MVYFQLRLVCIAWRLVVLAYATTTINEPQTNFQNNTGNISQRILVWQLLLLNFDYRCTYFFSLCIVRLSRCVVVASRGCRVVVRRIKKSQQLFLSNYFFLFSPRALEHGRGIRKVLQTPVLLLHGFTTTIPNTNIMRLHSTENIITYQFLARSEGRPGALVSKFRMVGHVWDKMIQRAYLEENAHVGRYFPPIPAWYNDRKVDRSKQEKASDIRDEKFHTSGTRTAKIETPQEYNEIHLQN